MGLCQENNPPDGFLILLTFFRTIMSEVIWPVARQSRQQAESAGARWIDGLPPVTQHSPLGRHSPIAFKRNAPRKSRAGATAAGRAVAERAIPAGLFWPITARRRRNLAGALSDRDH